MNTNAQSFTVVTRAPSNIALVKYMGKHEANLPANDSLSLTLSTLCTLFELRGRRGTGLFSWSNQLPKGASDAAQVPDLNESARVRMQNHLLNVARQLGQDLEGWDLEIRTANTFPQSSGIASSASSFAAATLAIASAVGAERDPVRLSALARQGSGSASRSLEGPWVQWQGESASQIEGVHASLADPRAFQHWVLISGSSPKVVSSSEAHLRVRSSPNWLGRVDRATARVESSRQALRSGNWKALCGLAWDEFQDMHTLFETAESPFSYRSEQTLEMLARLEPAVKRGEILVTLDAGPNIHVIARAELADQWGYLLSALASGVGAQLLMDTPGLGAQILERGL